MAVGNGPGKALFQARQVELWRRRLDMSLPTREVGPALKEFGPMLFGNSLLIHLP
jgi:hypothetical protein